MRVQLGYPAAAAEREMLRGVDRRELVNSLRAVVERRAPARLQQAVLDIHVAPALLDYVQALVAHTRSAAGWRRACRRAPRSACCAPRAPGH